MLQNCVARLAMKILIVVACVVGGGSLVQPEPAFGLTLEQCSRSPDGHHLAEGDHQDLGAGIIFSSYFSSLDDLSAWWELVECGSGKHLRIKSMSVTADENWDERAKLKQLIMDAAMSDNAYTLDDLPALFGLPEKRYMITISDRETCGCRAAYPFKRRGKTGFKFED